MKRILLALLLLTVFLAGCVQSNVTEFLEIPVEGSKSTMIRKLERKGFVYDESQDWLEGEFNGAEVRIAFQTQNGKVWRLWIAEKNLLDASEIKTKYENLCKQFESSSKYSAISVDPLPESEELEYEMAIHKKEYQARYTQFPEKEDSFNRTVQVIVSRQKPFPFLAKYSIVMYYENGFNKASREDL